MLPSGRLLIHIIPEPSRLGRGWALASRLCSTGPFAWLGSRMSRLVLHAFERYQRERLVFSQAALDFARQQENVDALVAAGGATLLLHLSKDPSPGIQHLAVAALGRLASHSGEVAQALVKDGFHEVLVAQMKGAPAEGDARGAKLEQHVRRAAAMCLRGLTKHGEALTMQIAGSAAVDVAVAGLQERDAEMQEASAWILGNIAGHSLELARLVADGGAVAPLAACLQSPELPVKRIAASALSDIAKHGLEMAQRLADAGVPAQLTNALQSAAGADTKLRRQACCALGQIGRASPELAAAIAQGGALAEIARCLDFRDVIVRRHAAVALRDMAKLGEGAAQAVADSSCLQRLVAAVAPVEPMLPAVMTLGYISAYTEALASKVVQAGAVAALRAVLTGGQPDHVVSAAVWALGMVGRHSAKQAKDVAGALPDIARLQQAEHSSEDLKAKCDKALSAVLHQLTDMLSLELLVQRPLPPPQLELVMEQISAAITADPTTRTEFVQSGALKAVEELGEAPGSPFKEYMERITAHFPEEIVKYYSPTYSKQLLSKLTEPPSAILQPVDHANSRPSTAKPAHSTPES